jgi:glycosyltransferase involved in cell wall biosynthesis
MLVWPLMGVVSGLDQVRQVRHLTAGRTDCVVHEPAPVSPRQPSMITGVGAPVVVGPLNGGMTYPSAFAPQVKKYEAVIHWILRKASGSANLLFRGKLDAAAVLVANERTRRALPVTMTHGRTVYMPENGVDHSVFGEAESGDVDPYRFVYVGRLVSCKMVEVLIDALHQLPDEYSLMIIGEGPMKNELETKVDNLDLRKRITFLGFQSQSVCAKALSEASALLLPSIHECGGAVVLEAMAMARPVIATKWGGPVDYITDGEDGILIEPDGYEQMVGSFAEAMRKVAEYPAFSNWLGCNGKAKVLEQFLWDRKIDSILEVFNSVLRKHVTNSEASAPRELSVTEAGN